MGREILALKPKVVDTIPRQLEDGILYVSLTFRTIIHKCCCGCGNPTVTPFPRNGTGWTVTVEQGESDNPLVTLEPSIFNTFECKSHYWIRQNRVVWA